MITDAQLADFCAAATAKRAPDFAELDAKFTAANGRPYAMPLTFTRGGKFARIVQNDGAQTSVYCFVRLEDGAILKSAGWTAPAKGARGNIANGAADVGTYGAAYAR